MITLFKKTLAAGLLAFATSSVSAGSITFNINGVFDTVGTVPDNTLAGLINTNYSASFTIGTDVSSTRQTEVNPTEGARAWLFNSSNGPYSSSLTIAIGSATNAEVVIAGILNDFYYDGSGGYAPAGIYDSFWINSWLYDPMGNGHIFDGQIGISGFNFNQAVFFFASSDLLADGNTFPFGNLDLSKILYGQYQLDTYEDGVLVGSITQDPPLSLVNGVLTGPNMTVSVAVVPEPATYAMLLTGLGLMGAIARRRKIKQV